MEANVKDRVGMLGGSDAAAILGQSPWSTPLDVYLESTGQKPPSDETENMYWGNVMEAPVAARYALDTGRKVHRVNRRLVHPDHPFIVGHVDRRIVGENALLEVKTSGSKDGWGEPGTDEIPPYYLLQVLHYMGVTGARYCDVAVLFFLFGRREFQIYRVERDEELIQHLVKAEVNFWQNHVEPGVPPNPTTMKAAAQAWEVATGMEVVATPEIQMDLIHLTVVQDWVKRAEKVEEALKLRSAIALKEADTLQSPDGTTLATWKEGTRRTLDTKALREAHPEICEEFTKVSKTRTFRLKRKEIGKLLLPIGAKPPADMTEAEFEVVQTLLESKEEVD